MTHLTIYRTDRKAVKMLGGMGAMKAFPVASWTKKGRGQYARYVPTAWIVPADRLPGYEPIDETEHAAIAAARRRAGKKAAATFRAKVDDLSSDLGLAPNSRTARALLAGYIDRAEAERIAAICRHRHEETNYDDLLASGMSKEEARALAQAQ
jgi:hypothetical protein